MEGNSWELLTARDLVATVKGPKQIEEKQQLLEETGKFSRWTGSFQEQAEVTRIVREPDWPYRYSSSSTVSF
jgi:hypothetical protein